MSPPTQFNPDHIGLSHVHVWRITTHTVKGELRHKYHYLMDLWVSPFEPKLPQFLYIPVQEDLGETA